MKGDVYFDNKFEFSDGTTGEKLFIVLHVSPDSKTALVIKTTSQPARYAGVKDGCDDKKPVFYFPVKLKAGFKTDTYAQLDEVFEYTSLELISGKFSGEIKFLFNLQDQHINAVLNCLKRYSDYIEEKYHTIFKK